MRALGIAYHTVTSLVALLALVGCVVLFALWRQEAREQAQIKSLSIDTADTVLLQHQTIGLLVESQKQLTSATQRLAKQYYGPPRTLASVTPP